VDAAAGAAVVVAGAGVPAVVVVAAVRAAAPAGGRSERARASRARRSGRRRSGRCFHPRLVLVAKRNLDVLSLYDVLSRPFASESDERARADRAALEESKVQGQYNTSGRASTELVGEPAESDVRIVSVMSRCRERRERTHMRR